MATRFRQTIAKYLALLMLILPIQMAGTPIADGQNGRRNGKSREQTQVGDIEGQKVELIFGDEQNSEYVQYLVNNTDLQSSLGIQVDGIKNKILKASQTNQTIQSVFEADQSMIEILKYFQPELGDSEAREVVKSYSILAGQDVNYYLEAVRKGSWGTTIMSVDSEGQVHFDSISLRTFLISTDYQDKSDSLQRLVREEFFQAHQYDSVAGTLFNNGYLARVALVNTPERLVKELSVGNMRAFLELFPQQKYLTDRGLGANSYNFYIGSELFAGPPASKPTVNYAYDKLAIFIREKLGISVDAVNFVDPNWIMQTNDVFRQKYLSYYTALGFSDAQVQIWNLVGMQRVNKADVANTLDMIAILDLPK